MTTVYKASGNTVTITAGGTITANDYVLVSQNLQGIAANDAASGEQYELITCGIVEVTKNTGASTDLAVGDKILWDASAGAFDNSASAITGDVYAGVAVEAASTSDTTAKIKLFDRPETI